MGYLRFCLALAVMNFHFSSGRSDATLNGGAAVNCFFVISGFLAALVLEKKYAGKILEYWRARALRIYLPYLAALALAFAYPAAVWYFFGILTPLFKNLVAAHPGPLASGVLGLSQLSLLGGNFGGLIAVNPSGGALCWVWHCPAGVKLMDLMLIPQAWSLSVEILFYLSAPWVVRWPTWILCLLALGTLAFDWTSPGTTSLNGYFCFGIVAWRARIRFGAKLPAWAPWLAAPVLVAALPLLGFAQAGNFLAPLGTAVLLPSLLAEAGRLDQFLGDLSYPLYLTHAISGEALAPWLAPGPYGISRLALLPFCLGIAVLFWFLVDRRILAWRR